jgi:hypothetical protein
VLDTRLTPRSPADPFDAGPYARLPFVPRLWPSSTGPGARRRALLASAVAWVPLLLLAAAEGLVFSGEPRESFLLDVSAHARYLVGLPILVLAEPWCLPRLGAIARQFGRSGVVVGEDRVRLEALVTTARRWLAHRGIQAVLVGVAYAATLLMSRILYPRGPSTWIAPGAGDLSLAGAWRVLVSQPLFLALVAGWLWRAAVWAWFLWGVSRLALRLVPSHPDLAGGLRFVSDSMAAFAPVALAFACPVSGTVASDMLFGGPERSLSPVVVLAVTIALSVCLFTGPLLSFVGPLRRARLRGVLEYGGLAGALGSRLEERWIHSGRRVDGDALAVPDFSATTDLYSIAGNVRRMALVPLGLRDLLVVAVATLLPFLPLVLLRVPLEEVLRGLATLFL